MSCRFRNYKQVTFLITPCSKQHQLSVVELLRFVLLRELMAHQNGTCVTMAHLAHIVLQTDDAVILFLGWWLISWLHIILIVVSCKVRVLTSSDVVADIVLNSEVGETHEIK